MSNTIDEITQLEEALRQAGEQVAIEVKDLRSALDEKARKLSEAQEVELKMRKEKRELEERHAAMELEIARKLDAERAGIEAAARKAAADEQQLQIGRAHV